MKAMLLSRILGLAVFPVMPLLILFHVAALAKRSGKYEWKESTIVMWEEWLEIFWDEDV
jgi:hypothetical protein